MTKKEADLAFKAGRLAHTIVWPDDMPDEQKAPGVHHCPFPEGDPQRAEWLRGYADVIERQAISPTIVKEINDSLKVADRAS